MQKLLKLSLASVIAVAALASAPSAFARRGADDPVGHVRQEDRQADRAASSSRADDRVAEARRADDPANHDANDDRVTGERRGRGADDPANHDANDDRGGSRGQ